MSLHRVVALVLPAQSTFELGCAAEVFGISRPGVPDRYTFTVCTERPGPVPTLAGYDIDVGSGLAALESAETIVIPGWQQRDTTASSDLIEALVAAHRRGARIVSICSGAFLLAQTGLLDGRRAATHWRMSAELSGRFPRIDVDPRALYIDNGDVATSAGAAAGIDLCLHLVRKDFGSDYSARIARHMVMPPYREGGQLQYVPAAVRDTGEALSPLLDWAIERIGAALSVDVLARRAGVSTRTLTRRFVEQLGISPGKWLLTQRINAARELLERTDNTVDAIAASVGFSSAVNLRRRFHDALDLTPGAYRRAFRLQSLS